VSRQPTPVSGTADPVLTQCEPGEKGRWAMSALHGDVPSLPLSAQLRQPYFAVITAHADDPV